MGSSKSSACIWLGPVEGAKFYTGRPCPPEVPTLTVLHIPCLIEMPSIGNCTPFHMPTEQLLLYFSLEKPLIYLDESAVRCVCSRYFESPFQYVNESFPSPLLYLMTSSSEIPTLLYIF